MKMNRYVCYTLMYIRIMVFDFESCKILPCYTIDTFNTIGTLSVSSCFHFLYNPSEVKKNLKKS